VNKVVDENSGHAAPRSEIFWATSFYAAWTWVDEAFRKNVSMELMANGKLCLRVNEALEKSGSRAAE